MAAPPREFVPPKPVKSECPVRCEPLYWGDKRAPWRDELDRNTGKPIPFFVTVCKKCGRFKGYRPQHIKEGSNQ